MGIGHKTPFVQPYNLHSLWGRGYGARGDYVISKTMDQDRRTQYIAAVCHWSPLVVALVRKSCGWKSKRYQVKGAFYPGIEANIGLHLISSGWFRYKVRYVSSKPYCLGNHMTKDQLIKIIKGLLDTDTNLNFLLQLSRDDLETLVACIRDRVGQVGRNQINRLSWYDMIFDEANWKCICMKVLIVGIRFRFRFETQINTDNQQTTAQGSFAPAGRAILPDIIRT